MPFRELGTLKIDRSEFFQVSMTEENLALTRRILVLDITDFQIRVGTSDIWGQYQSGIQNLPNCRHPLSKEAQH